MDLTERFIGYLEFNTESVNGSKDIPSSVGQHKFMIRLINELEKIGLDDVEYLNGVVYAHKKSDYSNRYKSIGFITHVDTYPLNCLEEIKTFIVDDYSGCEVLEQLKKKYPKEVIKTLDSEYIHKKLVFSKDATPLGADDKAGVAEVVTAMERIIKNKINTTDIYLAFTCDEEIGRGARLMDFSRFNPDYVIVLDGEYAGEIHLSNMSVFSCGIRVKGVEYYVGHAKGIVNNAIDIVNEFMNEFIYEKKPQTSEGKEGFFNFGKIQGDSKNIILMCSAMGFEEGDINYRIQKIYDVCEKINNKYGKRTISVIFPKGGYSNYSENINNELVDLVEEAMKNNRLLSKKIAFRGVTDSAYVCEYCKDVITIGIGGSSFHSIYEWASIDDMEKTTNTIIYLCSQLIKK